MQEPRKKLQLGMWNSSATTRPGL